MPHPRPCSLHSAPALPRPPLKRQASAATPDLHLRLVLTTIVPSPADRSAATRQDFGQQRPKVVNFHRLRHKLYSTEPDLLLPHSDRAPPPQNTPSIMVAGPAGPVEDPDAREMPPQGRVKIRRSLATSARRATRRPRPLAARPQRGHNGRRPSGKVEHRQPTAQPVLRSSRAPHRPRKPRKINRKAA